MKAVATLPSEASCINAESATYIPRWILHSSASLALCASSAMQEMCAHCSSEWFPAITESCAGYLANSIERHDISSVTTLLLQLAANVECWSCKERTESISTSDFKALQTLDATALAYLAHESAVVRRGAYRLLTANQHAYEGVGTSGKTWCLGSHIEQNGLYQSVAQNAILLTNSSFQMRTLEPQLHCSCLIITNHSILGK